MATENGQKTMTSRQDLDIPMVVASVYAPNYAYTEPNSNQRSMAPNITVFDASMAPEAQVVTIDGDTLVDEATPLVMPSRSFDSISHDHPAGQTENGNGTEKASSAPVFRDWPFAILFYAHIAAIIYVGVVYSAEGYRRVANDFDLDIIAEAISQNDDVNPEDLAQVESFVEEAYAYLQGYPQRILVYSICPSAVLLFFFMDVMLTTCLRWYTTFWVTKTLLFSVTLTAVIMCALVIAEPSVFGVILACIVIGASIYFTWSVWSIIPFLSVNLKIALDGMRSNFGTYMWALFLSDLSSLFVLVWGYVIFGISFYEHSTCEDRLHPEEDVHLEEFVKTDADECSMNGWTVLLLLLSLYWTTNVIGNFIQVVISGVMATWLYDSDEARGCCSSAVWGSLHRGMTYSFGSICFGSLVQGFVSILRWMTQGGRKNRQDPSRTNQGCCGTMLCSSFVECVADLWGDVIDCCTQWNYIYIALYGFAYVESGKRVTQLFRTKGFVSIMTERLAGFVLGWVTVTMGIYGGAIVLLVERIVTMKNPDPQFESYVYGPMPNWRVAAFLCVSKRMPLPPFTDALNSRFVLRVTSFAFVVPPFLTTDLFICPT